MKQTLLCVIVLFSCFAQTGSIQGIAEPSSQPPGHQIQLASKRLEDGSVLQMLCDTGLSSSDMDPVFGKGTSGKGSGVFRYHAELVPKENGTPITIWTTLEPMLKDSPDPNPLPCLDMACGNSQFIAVFEGGGQLWLYYQDYQYIGAPVGSINLIAGDWSLYAASGPIDTRELNVTISVNADNDWEIKVVHRNAHDGRTTLYRKPKDKWEFNVVSSNRDPGK